MKKGVKKLTSITVTVALSLVLGIGGISIPGMGEPIVPGTEANVARAATAAPYNVKLKIKKAKGGKVKVTASWSGSAPKFFVNVYNYYAGGYANQWRYTASHSVTMKFDEEEGIPYKYTVQVWGHNGGDRGNDATYSKEVRKSKTYQLAGPQMQKIQSIINSNGVNSMSDFDKIRFAHDWIVKNFTYDDSKADSSFTFPGAMKTKTAVCQGYSKTFEVFMACLGIPVDYVSNNTHGWNLVKLSGKWYHVDCTYDDPTGYLSSYTSEYPIYDYFLQSTANLKTKLGARIHSYDVNKWQKATSTIYDNQGDTSGYSEEIPGGEGGTSSSTFTPWMNGQPIS